MRYGIRRSLLALFFSGLTIFSSCTGRNGGTLSPASSPPQNVKLVIEVNEDYSCPFLYTWDGREFRIENDVFSVARGRDREYLDFLFIKNPVSPVGGKYSFEIRERQSEQSWTDMARLMVIDHPASVRVGIDSRGQPHSYANPLPPAAAFDDRGNSILEEIRAPDALSVDAYHSSSITLDFSNVDITQAAKLVLEADGFEGSLSGAFIPEVPSIKVQTVENSRWVTRYSFYPREFLAEGVFELKPFLSESRLVKLETASCYEGKFHKIDLAGMDNSPDSLAYSIVGPESASLNGIDVTSTILESDGSYALLDEAETIKMAFPCPPNQYQARSFAFITEGYYRVKGNSFYVQTWDGSAWVEQGHFSPTDYHQDRVAEFDLTNYLPDAEGDYKVRIEHRSAPGVYISAEGNLDYIYLMEGDRQCLPVSAVNGDSLDVLAPILENDDVRWLATNQWVIVKF